MAVENPCNADDTVVNTGSECDDAMGVTGMIILVPKNWRGNPADWAGNAGLTNYINDKFHATGRDRWIPIFGQNIPVRGITDSNEADVLFTFEDGSTQLIRRGMMARTYMTDKGGFCLAQHYMRINGTQYAFIEVDVDQKVIMLKNADGTRSGIPLNLAYSPTPELKNLKTPYQNKFYLSFSADNYIVRSIIYKEDQTEDVINLKGLLDVAVTQAAAPATSGGTAPTGGTTTFTAIGANNDTVSHTIDGITLTAAPVSKTGTETTVTLLATKYAAAVTANSANNGGITATSSSGVVTYVIPAAFGTSLNGLSPVQTIVGTIAATEAAFSGGVDGTVVLKVAVATACGETDLIDLYPGTSDPGLVQAQNFIVKLDSVVKTATAALTSGYISLTVTGGEGEYNVALAAASILKGNGVPGYEGTQSYTVQVP